MELLDLQNIAGGALQEKVDAVMNKVLENMQDQNTPWKVKRHITIKIAFTQNEERDDMAVDLSVDMKLAPVSPIRTRMAIGKDLKNGNTYAEEYGRQIKGQMSLELGQSPSETVLSDDADTEDGKVIDLRKAAL